MSCQVLCFYLPPPSGCVLKGTKILLAGGKHTKKVQALKYDNQSHEFLPTRHK
jgi:hypothetical protein